MDDKNILITIVAIVAILGIVAFSSFSITGAATTQNTGNCQQQCSQIWFDFIYGDITLDVARNSFLTCMSYCNVNSGGRGQPGVCQISPDYCDSPRLDLRCSMNEDRQSCTSAGCYWCPGPRR